jgi:hypothetical protein
VPALSEVEQRALAELKPDHPTWLSTKASGDWGGSSPYSAALGLARKGLARELKGCRFEPIAYDAEKAAEPDWIWLPNTIVTGAAGETAPVHLLRQAQNPSALRLFVDLYHRTDWPRTAAFTGGESVRTIPAPPYQRSAHRKSQCTDPAAYAYHALARVSGGFALYRRQLWHFVELAAAAGDERRRYLAGYAHYQPGKVCSVIRAGWGRSRGRARFARLTNALERRCKVGPLHHDYLRVPATSLNTVLTCVPTDWTATMMNTAIRLAISAYSIAVTPDSSLTNFSIALNI